MSSYIGKRVLSIAAGLAAMTGMGTAFRAARAPVESFSQTTSASDPFLGNRGCGSDKPKHKKSRPPAGTKFARLAREGRVGIRPMGVVGKAIREMQREKNLQRLKERKQKLAQSVAPVEQRAAA